jgi:hypothetical protein
MKEPSFVRGTRMEGSLVAGPQPVASATGVVITPSLGRWSPRSAILQFRRWVVEFFPKLKGGPHGTVLAPQTK